MAYAKVGSAVDISIPNKKQLTEKGKITSIKEIKNIAIFISIFKCIYIYIFINDIKFWIFIQQIQYIYATNSLPLIQTHHFGLNCKIGIDFLLFYDIGYEVSICYRHICTVAILAYKIVFV